MSFRWLVTGYGPFGGVPHNHTGGLALSLGQRAAVLEVSYAAVDAFLDRLDPDTFDAWLALGHDMRATNVKLETLGRNTKGRPDVRGVPGGGDEIEPGGPSTCASLLLCGCNPGREYDVSDNAGDYLCNYVLFRGQRRFPTKPVGFLHLPPPEVLPLVTQHQQIASLMRSLEKTVAGP